MICSSMILAKDVFGIGKGYFTSLKKPEGLTKVDLSGFHFEGVERMLKSCKYCGRIHEEKDVCDQKKKAEEKRQANRKHTDALKFRRSPAWTEKSMQIRKRDQYMCLCCRAQLIGTITKYNVRNVSVHHITPINEDYGMRLDDGNLITVCAVHHEMCEAEEITREQQRDLVKRSIQCGDHGEWEICV